MYLLKGARQLSPTTRSGLLDALAISAIGRADLKRIGVWGLIVVKMKMIEVWAFFL